MPVFSLVFCPRIVRWWLPALGLLTPALVWVEWQLSPVNGLFALALMAASHLALAYGTLRPNRQWFGPVMTGFVPRKPGEVWLTIDDGPDPGDTPRLLDLLDAASARATFFVRGDRARAHPALITEIVRRGHTVGNHTFSHPQATFWCVGPGRAAREIADCNHVLREITGHATRLFRAPVGHVNPFVVPAAEHHGLRLVGWSARGFDGVASRAAEPRAVVDRILRDLRPGGIVLLHEGRRGPAGQPVNVQALSLLLDALAARGWRGVIPSEMRCR